MATDLERLTVLIEANTKSYENAMKRLQKRTEDAINASKKSVDSLDKRLGELRGTAAKMAGALGIGLSAGWLIDFIKRSIEAGSKIGDLANKIGVTAEEVQQFSFAASQSGSSLESWSTAMDAMTRKLGEAAKGSKEAQDDFKSLGVSYQDIAGKSPVEVFELIADRISALGDPLERNAALMKIFGRSGAEMAELVSGGAKGIEALRDQAQKLGLVLSNAQIRAFKEAGDQLDIMGRAGQVAGMNFASGFLPAMERLSEVMTDEAFQQGMRSAGLLLGDLVKLMVDNADTIERFVGAFAGLRLGAALGGVAGPAGSRYGAILGAGLGAAAPELRSLLTDMADQKASSGGLRFDVTGYQAGGTGRTSDASTQAYLKSLVGPTSKPWKSPTADQDQAKIDAVTKSLKDQLATLTMTDREQAVYNALAQAGVTANTKAGQQISDLAGKLHDQKQALEAANQAAQFFGQSMESALEDMILNGASAQEVLAQLVKQLAAAALQASLLGTGPLAGLFGTTASSSGGVGGLFGSLFSALGFGGARAGGGPVDAGKAYVVGEKRPELFIPSVSGTIANVRAANNNAPTNITIQVNGARGNTEIRQMVADGVAAGIGANNKAQSRLQLTRGD